MANLLASGLVGLAIALGAAALLAMAAGDFGIAGVCFLSLSIVLYLRETRVLAA